MIARIATALLMALSGATCALSAEPDTTVAANAGKVAFREQCALCHSAQPNDNGGAQGPNLYQVYGRHAAADPLFSYSAALRASHLTWDAATLDRFLTNPYGVAPGTAMIISVPSAEVRGNLIAYFRAVKDGTFQESAPQAFRPPPPTTAAANAPRPRPEADWRQDAPGQPHRIEVAQLPAPFVSASANNFPRLVSKPPDARLLLPAGFTVAEFTREVQAPRELRLAPNGDIFLTETQSGRVKVLRPSADGTRPATVSVFAQGLSQPSGMGFYPQGQQPRWLYVAENNRVVRYPYRVGDLEARALPEIIVPTLSPVAGGGHFTRDLVFSADGKRMFISVGSQSNVAESMPKKSPEEIKDWEAEHGFGAAWGNETNRADVLVFDVGMQSPGHIFASGIRNCAGLSVEPRSGDLWCTTNERDLLGDDLVPDYSTRVKEGGFYGWPWYYMGSNEDPRHAGERPDLVGKVLVPDVPYQAHSAALSLIFYTANKGRSAFPPEYVGDGFAVMHGSWNRAFRTGHKVVRVRMHDGVPTGEYDDFLVGFIVDDGHAWARPVGALQAQDGSLLISDDGNDVIYRISYAH
jgi:glucose/arabinose dehydrogenase